MDSLADATFIKSANSLEGCPRDSGREVAFAGRSNAGKSSALNVITTRRSLARTSKTPGRTQLINFFGVAEDQRLVDLPGYGFAKVPSRVKAHWRRLIGDYFETRESLVGLVVMMDCRRPLTPADQRMLGFAGAAGLPVHILLTKADKLSRGAAAAAFRNARAQLDPRIGVQLFSALKKYGVEQAREVVVEWLRPQPAQDDQDPAKEKDPGAD